MDLVKIAQVCAAECVRQQADTISDVRNLLIAYEHMLRIRDGNVPLNETSFKTLGGIIDPVQNYSGFRRTPVTFRNGGSSGMPSEIPRLMINLRDNIHVFLTDPPPVEKPHRLAVSREEMLNALVKEFLWIHPFKDGNGRVGFLLYNYLRGTLDSPDPLPYYFGDK